MRFGTAPLASRFWRIRRARREGGGTVACAAAAPLVVLALAVAADYASVSRFKTCVQLAADAASLAAAAAIVRDADHASGSDVDNLASRVAATVFVSRAPRGAAGTPTVAVKSSAVVVTATLGYAGVAPRISALRWAMTRSVSTLPRPRSTASPILG